MKRGPKNRHYDTKDDERGHSPATEIRIQGAPSVAPPTVSILCTRAWYARETLMYGSPLSNSPLTIPSAVIDPFFSMYKSAFDGIASSGWLDSICRLCGRSEDPSRPRRWWQRSRQRDSSSAYGSGMCSQSANATRSALMYTSDACVTGPDSGVWFTHLKSRANAGCRTVTGRHMLFAGRRLRIAVSFFCQTLQTDWYPYSSAEGKEESRVRSSSVSFCTTTSCTFKLSRTAL